MRTPLWKQIKSSLKEPRLVTGATVAAYAVLLGLGLEVIFFAYKPNPMYWLPAIMMFVGAWVGLPCAWKGGREYARWELVFMPISIAGLCGGILIESTAIWALPSARYLLMALGLIVLFVVIARWVYIRRLYDL